MDDGKPVIVRAISTVCCLAIVPTLGFAAEVSRFFGHSVTVEGGYPERSLKVDGREMHKNATLTFDEVTHIAGVPVLIGVISNGGNACDGTPFVISFPPSGNPRFDGPLETCAATTYEIGELEIIFSTNNLPGKGQERWAWTPGRGIRKLADEEFKPTAKSGWDALRERTLDHPSRVFENVEISAQVTTLLGSKIGEYTDIIVGTGSGEFKGDDYFGSACTAHMCGDEEAMIFLDAANRKVFAAWKPYQKKIVVYPAVAEWPEKARQELKTWAAKWK